MEKQKQEDHLRQVNQILHVDRSNASCYPKQKIFGERRRLKDNQLMLTIHTAGQHVLWEIPVVAAVVDHDLLSEMLPQERDFVRMLYQRDCSLEEKRSYLKAVKAQQKIQKKRLQPVEKYLVKEMKDSMALGLCRKIC